MGRTSDHDAHLEWVRPTRSGRQAGCWVYVDAYTLRQALGEAGLDAALKAEDLEVLRTTMPAGKRVAQVLLKFRPRQPEASP
jgi:hypothetical protein